MLVINETALKNSQGKGDKMKLVGVHYSILGQEFNDRVIELWKKYIKATLKKSDQNKILDIWQDGYISLNVPSEKFNEILKNFNPWKKKENGIPEKTEIILTSK